MCGLVRLRRKVVIGNAVIMLKSKVIFSWLVLSLHSGIASESVQVSAGKILYYFTMERAQGGSKRGRHADAGYCYTSFSPSLNGF